MCGIVGKISFNNVIDADRQIIEKMALLLAHRGPDYQGIYNDNNVVLAHRRLAIIDTANLANQPMLSDDQEIVLVFNGEIYNHTEIRKELKNKYAFRTDHSDTETIIYAYKEWGIDCIKKFNGFFAFCIYDKKKNEIYLVRDRFGKKPLYYILNDSTCYFASEAHVFFRTNIINKEFNEEAIYHYLTFLTTPTPSTFFKNVYKLEAGYYLKISKQGVEKQQYFNISDYINIDNKDSFETAVNITREKLESSMKYRNVADVGVCVALSGGLDSSLNLYYSKDINKNIKAINIAYEKTSSFDESVISKKLADEYDVSFIGKKITDTMFNNLIDKYISLGSGLDRPMGTIDEVLVYLLSITASKSKSKVILVGEGGDELGGYPIYKTMNFINKTFGKFSSFEDIFKFLPSRISRKLNFYNGSLVSNMHIHGFTEREKSNLWVGAKDFNSFKILNDYMTEIRDDLNDSYLRKIINIEYKLRLPELILSRIDYPSMAASVEARSPFMDHELIQYSSSLSFGVKMKNGPKSILKAIASDRLPDYILNHPKIGFGGLLNPFLCYTMPIWFHKELIETKSDLHNLISIDYCKYMYERHEKKKNMGYQMWILYILSRWFRINFDG